jgi:hypothetical protein
MPVEAPCRLRARWLPQIRFDFPDPRFDNSPFFEMDGLFVHLSVTAKYQGTP